MVKQFVCAIISYLLQNAPDSRIEVARHPVQGSVQPAPPQPLPLSVGLGYRCCENIHGKASASEGICAIKVLYGKVAILISV